jgi:RHS repeat-associated protein
MKLGNGKWEHTAYDPKRLQPTQIGLGVSSTDSSLLKLDYTYGTTSNNGNVLTQTITIGATVMGQSYSYDNVNRLLSASENSGANWSQSYGYDRFGNRWVSASTGYTLSSLTPQSQSAFNAGNNRLVSSGYDVAGNQTSDFQSRTFTYDAENRQITFNGSTGQYFYDGDGDRVKKIDGAGTTVFVYNSGGQLTAEYHSDPVPSPPGGGGTSYLTSDHLGSTRVVTKSDGTVKARYDYLPFGDELGSGIGQRTTALGYSLADSTKQKFTQKERDNESGLDYFLARYYSSAQGRFTSPDEFTGGPDDLFDFAEHASTNPTFYADIVDPQTLNKYQYALNNPLRYIDPDGHQEKQTLTQRLKEGASQTILGATSAFLQDNGINVDSKGNSVGRFIGHLGALVQGVSEVVQGGTAAVGGGTEAVVTAPAAATVVGAVVPATGVVVAIAGAIEVAHGTAVIVNTIHNASRAEPGSRPGQDFTPAGKREMDARSGGKCENCGTETVQVQNQKGQSPPSNQRQRHHIKLKSEGGSGTPENGKVLCRTCHQETHQKLRGENLQ